MERKELGFLLWFNHIDGLGPSGMDKIARIFGTFERAYDAKPQQWLLAGLSSDFVTRMNQARVNMIPDMLLKKLDASGQNVLCCIDADYPTCLKNIKNHPYLLFYRGRLGLLANPGIAIVGARRASSYGRGVARNMAREISDAGITVNSGMASGIDTEAHKGALLGGASTIAVLGSGLDIVYPAENRSLFKQICEEGLAISEYSPGTPAKAAHFPARNRIIAGLSHGIVVVEARARSGALITADFGLEQGRDIMAVPGPITSPLSDGTHSLIKQGARLVANVEDIWEETGLLPVSQRASKSNDVAYCQMQINFEACNLDENQKKLVEWLDVNDKSMDELLALSGWEIGVLATVLLQLEIKGLVKSKPGNYYIMSTSQ